MFVIEKKVKIVCIHQIPNEMKERKQEKNNVQKLVVKQRYDTY